MDRVLTRGEYMYIRLSALGRLSFVESDVFRLQLIWIALGYNMQTEADILHTSYLAQIDGCWGFILMISNRGVSNGIFLTHKVGGSTVLCAPAMF